MNFRRYELKTKKFSKKEIIDFCSMNDLFEVQPFTGGIYEGKLSVFFCDVEVLDELQRFANLILEKLNEKSTTEVQPYN